MSLYPHLPPTSGTNNLFTTLAASLENASVDSRKDGTRQLARAVIAQAVRDLGTWCHKCPGEACECHQTREGALAFLRDEAWHGKASTLALWCDVAQWPRRSINQFFSPERTKQWVRFVLKMRSPYRRVRRGARAPAEATIIDLVQVYRTDRGALVFTRTPQGMELSEWESEKP